MGQNKPSSRPTPRRLPDEASQLAFTTRIAEQAEDPRHPLAEQARFLGLAAASLDEFVTIYLARHDRVRHPRPAPRQRRRRRRRCRVLAGMIRALRDRLAAHWQLVLGPALAKLGAAPRLYSELDRRHQIAADALFTRELLPRLTLTELAADLRHPGPLHSPCLVVATRDASGPVDLTVVTWPGRPPGLLRLGDGTPLWFTDLVEHQLCARVEPDRWIGAFAVRPLFAADDDPDYREGDDPEAAITAALEARRHARIVRLELAQATPPSIVVRLARHLGLTPQQVDHGLGSARGLEHLLTLPDDPRAAPASLLYPPLVPYHPRRTDDLFAALRHRDIALYHPYDSFTTVLEFLGQAARDPAVERLALTLYRCGPNSPVVAALLAACAAGKQVLALVELRARGDERENLAIATQLRAGGAVVQFGPPRIKVHAKLCLVERREGQDLRAYAHLGTGNYHSETACSYTDLGLLTADPRLTQDVAELVAALFGIRRPQRYRHLLVGPTALRPALLTRIQRLTRASEQGQPARIILKLNALVDSAIVSALYRASAAGVQIDLQVRGRCRLRPGVAGLSESIRVRSLVGRFLEHARVLYFSVGDQEELWLGSADLMPRNLDRRIELLFPVLDPSLRAAILSDVLLIGLRDFAYSYALDADGRYHQCEVPPGEPRLDVQAWLLAHGGRWRGP